MLFDALHAHLTYGADAVLPPGQFYADRLPPEQPATQFVHVVAIPIPDEEPRRIFGGENEGIYLHRAGVQFRARGLEGKGYQAQRVLLAVRDRLAGLIASPGALPSAAMMADRDGPYAKGVWARRFPADPNLPGYADLPLIPDSDPPMRGYRVEPEIIAIGRVGSGPWFLEQDKKGRPIYVLSARFEHRPAPLVGL